MSVLVAKLALAPTFVVLVSLVARRFGPRIGGVVGGLPVVAGPILLVLAPLLRSMVIGFFSFAAFLATVAATLEPWGIAAAFLAALAVTAAIQVVILAAVTRAAPEAAAPHGT